ncbi:MULTISPECIES: LLM class F420-dependent oxidoreductase [Parafrankia]|uniref:LLM class F420-dependent oxidoreductase n=1 Tax=Parafrankia soli TaxID=2599596 RepID=A0A1S1RH33_9ACTN|nr:MULTISPECIES: LLM class F420-dependent oxidoreductase [Parafrankia]OHV45109.1 LLM class F420-dependent oxidoreductase [Parafrankia soli]TCJ33457.1 LLM class F420-dependent oxidoreductase [Parafrankia sp. BMG5.11]CAI7974311.1 LLM class F420-dependent oxidoreductase [Frankia sp. Hr75.2]SQD94164.1 conserved hypothetical protein [Parafrankia sp. Ea1.12]
MAVDVGGIGVWRASFYWPGDAGQHAEIAAELEDLGYDAIWIGASAGDLALPETLLDATSRIAVATGIVNVWTEPLDQVVASYARVSGAHPDRLLLGIGAGHAANVEPTGQRYERPYRKVVDYLDGLDAAKTPVPRENRALAALGPRVLALAAERTAGAHPYLVPPEHTRRAREILGSGPLLAVEQKVVLETDPERARTIARATVNRYMTLPNYTNNLLRLGFTPDDFGGGGSDRLVDALVAWGDLDAVLSRVREHQDAGADHVCIHVLTEDPTTVPRPQWRALATALDLVS